MVIRREVGGDVRGEAREVRELSMRLGLKRCFGIGAGNTFHAIHQLLHSCEPLLSRHTHPIKSIKDACIRVEIVLHTEYFFMGR